jgi:hypothetical protein
MVELLRCLDQQLLGIGMALGEQTLHLPIDAPRA